MSQSESLKPKDITRTLDDHSTIVERHSIVDGHGREIVADVVDEQWRDRLITAWNRRPSTADWGEVEVRALEWEERSGAQYADTAYGEAYIDQDGDGFYVIEQGRKHCGFGSLDAAKSFIQSNHDRWVTDWLSPASAARIRSALATTAGEAKGVQLENVLEDAAKAAFVKAQSVYRGDYDRFPLKYTWETTDETVREGWRNIAHAALEAAHIPPLGTQPEPRHPRDVAAILAAALVTDKG